jgi:hypothetical protein
MAFNGSGTFVRLYNWVNDKANSIKITASRMDAEMDGMATGLSTCITKDGQTVTTARVPFAAGLSAGAGLVGTPAIVLDPTNAVSGLYQTTANEWRLSLNSTLKYTFGSNFTVAGNIGCGTTGGTQGSIGFNGSTSGSLTVRGPAVAGSNTLTLPAGTTDFTATGGTSQVVKQTSAGGAFTVAQLAASDLSNGTTGTGAVALAASPTFTGTLTAATVAPTNVTGTTTNNDAATGAIGEYIESEVLFGSAVSLTNATPANVTSISLTAGDWDVSGNVGLSLAAATTVTRTIGCVNTTSATLTATPGKGSWVDVRTPAAPTGLGHVYPVGTRRLSLASTTTVYLVARADFAVDTAAAFGCIRARRAR